MPQFAVCYGLTYADDKTVPTLPEELGVDVAAMMNVENFFAGGRARAPWTLSIADAGGSRQVASAPPDSSYGLLRTRSVDVPDRQSAVLGKSVGARVILGGRRSLKKKK